MIIRGLTLFCLCALLQGCATTESSDPQDSGSLPDYNSAHMRIDINGKLKTIVIQLDPSAAPKTVANFKKNVNEGFYKGLAFHRVIPNYLVQTGDPLTRDEASRSNWGTGGPGYTLPAEIKLPHKRGAVAMARIGDAANPSRDSNGSQFYIALAPLVALDGKYTVFGEITQGLELLDEMARARTDPDDVPLRRIEVHSIALARPNAPVAKIKKSDSAKPKADSGSGEDSGVTKLIRRFW